MNYYNIIILFLFYLNINLISCNLLLNFTNINITKFDDNYITTNNDNNNSNIEIIPLKNNNNNKNNNENNGNNGNLTSDGEGINNNNELKNNRNKWITELFNEAESIFDLSYYNVSRKCARDVNIYKMHLANQSVWAVRMLESREWPSVGIYTGMRHHFGNFDECLKVNEHGVKGKYCLVDAKYYSAVNPNLKYDEITFPLDEKESIWDSIAKLNTDPIAVQRNSIQWALCIPASCTSEELNYVLNHTLTSVYEKHNLKIDVNVKPELCRTKTEREYTTGYYVTCTVLGALVLMLVIGTSYDVYLFYKPKGRGGEEKEKEGNSKKKNEILIAFSFVNNYKKLFSDKSSSNILIIHALKVFNIIMAVYGHRFIYTMGYPVFNIEYAENIYRTHSSIELVHTNVIDVFFMISGFLTYYYGYEPCKKGGLIYYGFSIFFRWLRMVPVFSIIIAFVVFIFPHLGDGPLWNQRVPVEVDNCWQTWWYNIIPVSNFVHPEKMCLVISWYIANDIQLCIIGGLILFVLTRKKKLGLFLVLLAFLLSTGITFLVTYLKRYDGALRLYISLLENPRNNEQFTNLYVSLYNRAGPYLVGFAAGYITKLFQERGYKLSGKQQLIGTILMFLIAEGGQYYGLLFYKYGRPYDVLENAIYASICRTLFALLSAWIIFAHITSGLGPFHHVIKRLKIVVPLGKLTYSVFLVNTVVQMYQAASQRVPLAVSNRSIFFWILGADLISSYICGFLLYILVEAPLAGLSKVLQNTIIRVLTKGRMNAIPRDNDEAPVTGQKDCSLITNGVNNKSFVKE